MIEHLNHITLNTGHVRKTYPHEVDKEVYFILQRMFRDSLEPSGAEIMEKYRLKTTQERDVAIATLYADDGMPVLTTGVSKHGDLELWKVLHHSSTVPLATDPYRAMDGPYIADRLEVGSVIHLDVLRWTGDFSKCFGWIVLAPEKIR